MTDLQREAREAALNYEQRRIEFVVEHQVSTVAVVQLFSDGYLAAAAPREQEIERLKAELAKTKLPLWMLREEHEQEVAALRGELADWEESARKAAGERCEDEIHCCCVPYLRVEIDRLRARVAELERRDDAAISLLRKWKYGWIFGKYVPMEESQKFIDAKPIPLPEAKP